MKRKGVRSPGAVCQKSVGRGNSGHRRRIKVNGGTKFELSFPAKRKRFPRFRKTFSTFEAAEREARRVLKLLPSWGEPIINYHIREVRSNAGRIRDLQKAAAIQERKSPQGKKSFMASEFRRKAAYYKAEARKKKAERKRNPAKRNPEALAAEAYREFHGKEPAKIITVDTPRHYHGVLAGIGKLDFVTFHRPEGKAKGIKFTAGTYLAENEKRTQLFITGGDQSVNLRDFGISKPHESEILGEVSEIGYRTEKLHLIEKDGGKGLYVHKFGTPRPTLIYDTRNKLLSFAGGGYTIPSEGIDG